MLLELGRMLLSLSVVLGLLWVIARVGRGRQAGGKLGRTRFGAGAGAGAGAGSGTTANRIDLLGRRSLGRHSAVLLIRAGNRTMVVGQTPQHITVLAECEPDQSDMNRETAAAGRAEETMPGLASETGVLTPKAWDALVDRLREMTVRH